MFSSEKLQECCKSNPGQPSKYANDYSMLHSYPSIVSECANTDSKTAGSPEKKNAGGSRNQTWISRSRAHSAYHWSTLTVHKTSWTGSEGHSGSTATGKIVLIPFSPEKWDLVNLLLSGKYRHRHRHRKPKNVSIPISLKSLKSIFPISFFFLLQKSGFDFKLDLMRKKIPTNFFPFCCDRPCFYRKPWAGLRSRSYKLLCSGKQK